MRTNYKVTYADGRTVEMVNSDPKRFEKVLAKNVKRGLVASWVRL